MKTFNILDLIKGRKIYYEQEWPQMSKVYFTVGMFFEKMVKIDEDISRETAKAWAEVTAQRIAELNDMIIIEVVVVKEDA